MQKNINIEKATPPERLKYLRAMLRLSRSYIEQKHHLSAATLKAWENGACRLTEKGLNRCISIYRQEGIMVNREWILDGVGLSPRLAIDMGRYLSTELQYPERHDQPRINDSDSLALPYNIDDDNSCILHEAGFFKDSYPDAIVLMVKTDDMEPVYQIGDYVGGRLRYGKDIDSIVKRDCIVRLKNGELILRRLFKSIKGNYYNLACINPLPTTATPIIFDADIESAAPVIWHRMPNPKK